MLNLLETMLKEALKQGAAAADIIAISTNHLKISQRLGQVDTCERSSSTDIGLRVFKGQKQAIVSTTHDEHLNYHQVIERALAMVEVMPEDPYTGLAADVNLATEIADLDLYFDDAPQEEDLKNLVNRAETTALSVAGITNSEGAHAEYGTSTHYLLTSHGFVGSYQSSYHSLELSVLAEVNGLKERDYDYHVARCAKDLKSPEALGLNAATRALKRLQAIKIPSTSCPVIFDTRIASSLLNHFASAINGQNIARKTSFLQHKMGQQIFNPDILIVDNPLRMKGLRSHPFDGEGVRPTPLTLIENGVLQTWILDSATAKQLQLNTNGHAARGTANTPSPSVSNLHMAAGPLSPLDLIKDITYGVYITELIGQGVNMITGDYSRGASGFLIENGQLTTPINEITIAGNLLEMFQQITPANDLTFDYGINAPTLRIDHMIIAGK